MNTRFVYVPHDNNEPLGPSRAANRLRLRPRLGSLADVSMLIIAVILSFEQVAKPLDGRHLIGRLGAGKGGSGRGACKPTHLIVAGRLAGRRAESLREDLLDSQRRALLVGQMLIIIPGSSTPVNQSELRGEPKTMLLLAREPAAAAETMAALDREPAEQWLDIDFVLIGKQSLIFSPPRLDPIRLPKLAVGRRSGAVSLKAWRPGAFRTCWTLGQRENK